jgi:hypothetical protein
VPIFELFDLGPDTGNVFDLPSLGGDIRAGVMIPTFYGIGDVGGALWTWTEAMDMDTSNTVTNKALTSNVATITTADAHNLSVGSTVTVSGVGAPFDGTWVVASVPTSTTYTYNVTAANVTSAASTGTTGTRKGCLKIPCPTWTECRMEAEGLCVTHGNLSDRAWPELTKQFLSIVMGAHVRRMSAAKIAKVLSTATTVTPDATMLLSDVAGDLLNVIELPPPHAFAVPARQDPFRRRAAPRMGAGGAAQQHGGTSRSIGDERQRFVDHLVVVEPWCASPVHPGLAAAVRVDSGNEMARQRHVRHLAQRGVRVDRRSSSTSA